MNFSSTSAAPEPSAAAEKIDTLKKTFCNERSRRQNALSLRTRGGAFFNMECKHQGLSFPPGVIVFNIA